MLGLKLTPDNFINAHVKEKCAIARSELQKIKKTCGELNKASRMNMIRAKVLVQLTYPAIPLHLASKTQMLKLQAVQNDALKFVHKVDHTHTE